jgi:hypothetical protein
MIHTFIILKQKFNKVIAFNIIRYSESTFVFTKGITKNIPWLYENSYSPKHRRLKIKKLSLAEYIGKKGYVEMAKWLYEAEPKICWQYASKWAAKKGKLEMLKWLHNIGKVLQKNNILPIIWAAENGQYEAAKWLYSIGASGVVWTK